MNLIDNPSRPMIYWHRDLPPYGAEPIGEHTIEAHSRRVMGNLAHRNELWDRCYQNLMAQVQALLKQEIARLGGNYAHVLSESVESRHDDATGETYLHGRFTYVLYRQSADLRPTG